MIKISGKKNKNKKTKKLIKRSNEQADSQNVWPTSEVINLARKSKNKQINKWKNCHNIFDNHRINNQSCNVLLIAIVSKTLVMIV